jgi:hypothetical protein
MQPGSEVRNTATRSLLRNGSLLDQARKLREQLHRRHCSQWPEARRLVAALQRDVELPLDQLHQHMGPFPLFRQGQDQHTPFHHRLYAAHRQVSDLFEAMAARLVREVIGEACYVQQVPTYRYGLPGNRWVGSFHHDCDFGHPPFELNAVLALTPMHASAALQVETTPGSYRYAPLELDAAELALFNHMERRHGCRRNREGVSVCSLDVRFVPLRFAAAAFDTPQHSLNSGVAMAPGGYFSAQPLPGR